MKPEDYPKLVLEVISFFGNRKVLASPEPNSAKAFFLVNSFAVAKRMAREDFYGDRTWGDIRDNEVVLIKKVARSTDGFKETDAKLWDAYKIGLKGIGPGLGSTTFSEVSDEVCGDYLACLYGRAFQGSSNLFIENLFAAYKCGGWPCGWHGDYPNGILAVYFP